MPFTQKYSSLFTPAGAKAIAAAIATKRHLVKLNLRENELGDRGGVTIARGIAKVCVCLCSWRGNGDVTM